MGQAAYLCRMVDSICSHVRAAGVPGLGVPGLAVPGLAVLGLAVLGAGCAEERPPGAPIAPEVLAAEHEEWRAGRQGSLTNPDGGVVSWAGLWDLQEGANDFGADPSLSIMLPEEDSPPFAGTLHLAAGEVQLVPAEGSGLSIRDGDAVTEPLALQHDRADNTTYLELGSLGLRIHSERGTDRLWLRAWDRDAPRIDAFELPPYFTVSNEWRIPARFDPYSEPRTVLLADVTGGTVDNVSPGELVFEAGGREHRLVAFATESSRNYFVTLWDSTGVSDTYQGGRYMRVSLPNDDGWTEIDFNRAYNPPCVFTPYSVCSLPPRENRLTLAVTAGEKRPVNAPY